MSEDKEKLARELAKRYYPLFQWGLLNVKKQNEFLEMATHVQRLILEARIDELFTCGEETYVVRKRMKKLQADLEALK